ncbi:unnamed protein product [Clonostachys chloroleuca]|uniref:Zn(2)-C6 fungal-type domain-containing protein n=1 Tax=Clonostachys chloroleuca TaxID=1926264 RepID=A0AA35Q2L2_9HYPO|nr:unnamed protein product [Clonostachys chloroleuca]
MEAPSSSDTGNMRARKLRKGTFSCLECKRRKRRCEFQPLSAECNSCRRRGLPCLSQGREPEIGQQKVTERVNHIEDLVTLLLQKRRHQGGRLKDTAAAAAELGSAVACPRSPRGTSISITTYLRSVLPPPAESALILSHTKSSHMPHKILWPDTSPSPRDEGFPPASAHPVLYGRKFMELALCLQDAQDTSGSAARYVEIVSRHISSLDVHMQSTEGIETLMLEAIYYVNDNKPKAAWLKCRRALSIAQLMVIEHPGWEIDQILARLVYGDRIMSLELGLPYFGVSGSISVASDENPSSRLEFAHSVLGCRIIERNLRYEQGNTLPVYDEEARGMDNTMRSEINFLPAGWWSIKPSLRDLADNEVMSETAKISTQLNHYWFLMQIHMPFIITQLRSPEPPEKNPYSGAVIATACRQVLSRFIVMRSYHDGYIYRGTDSKATSAAIMLLMTHIQAHRYKYGNDIQHLRPQDIDLVREMLKLVDLLYKSENRGLKIKKLLKIEADAAIGGLYMLVEGTDEGLPFLIPYIGHLSLVKVLSPHQESQFPWIEGLIPFEPNASYNQLEGALLLQEVDSLLEDQGAIL